MKVLIQKLPVPEFIVELIDELENHGFAGYVVGGAVRDMLLGKEPEDWDIATDASPSDVMKIFPRVIPTGIKHGTVSVLTHNRIVEVTQFRGDNQHAGSITDDLKHRDFTINALAYNPSRHQLVDPWNGLEDLEKGIIRAVENPEERFSEDPLRILRAIRLAASFKFRIEEKTLKTIPDFALRLRNVSIERIRDEFLKILETNDPSGSIESCRKLKILEVILPEILEGYGMRQNRYHVYDVYWHTLKTVDFIPQNSYLRWVGLLHDVGKPKTRQIIKGVCHFYGHAKVSAEIATEIMQRWRFSNAEIDKAQKLIANHMLHNFKSWKPSTFRRLIIRVGKENIYDLLILWKADRLAHGTETKKKIEEDFRTLKKKISRTLETFQVFSVKDLAIGGKEVMEIMGVPPGPIVGEVLHRLLEEVIQNPEKNNPKDLKALVAKIKDIYEKPHS
ncbi:MAG: polynucleotide adenylyltransferase [Deltaproteobacteria bacterium]|nr:MAG: polynucleotide adenylyltransferase [Deltaproteobacteria bacterium]RLB08575.1 MAG: polynucleotide adenylyltransferase [Deltaproteobacteria bacterium]HEC31718.1 CCA tRNA nucleotidyltransferase [Deltaproteobacteria bacterium]